ncbi:MAG: hypothetical protein PHV17_00435 [Candidatus Omnitrophica bacterium]|nr:hypothetical protein [Candidatus Omnitrophota bacterium]
MSIIYEALKKLELKKPTKGLKVNNRTRAFQMPYKTNYFAVVIIVFISLGFLFWFNKFSDSLLGSQKIATSPVNALSGGLKQSDSRSLTRFAKSNEAGFKVEKTWPLTRQDIKESFSDDIYQLQGILYTEDKPFAFINGRKVNVGDWVNNARVDKITVNGVELVSGNDSFVLGLNYSD